MINKDKKIVAKKAGKSTITIKHTYQNITKTATITVKEEKNNIEVKNGITYVNGILIANKTYSLPKDYDPGKINDDALKAFEEMRQAASKDKITLWIQSGYRSYKTQEELYNNYVKQNGKEKADTFSARPGHSEHQSGYAMDLNIIDSSFEGTKEAIWIEKNCYKYGFILRYPKGKEKITGYKYEPWHLRYLGKDLAKKVFSSGLTLEEYLGIDSKYKD
ncbi:MAG: M15 family metallopeptidase [Bacilli bacterium]|nr:M15 family metallopeptidase [Bacilli bacterium]